MNIPNVVDFLLSLSEEEFNKLNIELYGSQSGTGVSEKLFIGITTYSQLSPDNQGEKPGQFPPIRR